MDAKQENDKDASSPPPSTPPPPATDPISTLVLSISAQITETAANPPASSKPKFKYSFQMGEVWKVHNKHGLDYWVYGFTVNTNDPIYAEASAKQPPPMASPSCGSSISSSPLPSPKNATGSGGKSSVYIGRRYHDFEWLRQVLVAEYPTSIVPGLPGMGLEGTLDKVTSIFKANDLSAITRYRRRGLDLFLNSLGRSPILASSPLIHVFATLSEEELTKFQKEWSKRVCHAPLLPSAWSSWSSMVVHLQSGLSTKVPRALDAEVEKAKSFATSESETMRQLRLRIETFWDDLILTQQPNYQPLVRESFPELDETINGLLDVTTAIGRALQTITPKNEELMLNITCDLEFCEGLCSAINDVVAFAEQLTQLDYLMAQRQLTNEEAYANVTRKIKDLSTNFSNEMNLYHKMRLPVVRRALEDAARLISVLDPSQFHWKERCSSASSTKVAAA